MNAPSDDVKDLLEGASLGLVHAINLHTSKMPATPDACVSVHDSGGFDPEAGYDLKRPTVQVVVRGRKNGSREAWALADAIRDVLAAVHNTTLGGSRIVGIWAMGDVQEVGYDSNDRPLYSVNFRIQRGAA